MGSTKNKLKSRAEAPASTPEALPPPPPVPLPAQQPPQARTAICSASAALRRSATPQPPSSQRATAELSTQPPLSAGRKPYGHRSSDQRRSTGEAASERAGKGRRREQGDIRRKQRQNSLPAARRSRLTATNSRARDTAHARFPPPPPSPCGPAPAPPALTRAGAARPRLFPWRRRRRPRSP